MRLAVSNGDARTSVFHRIVPIFPAMFRVIFHLDMDAFYASVEQRDNPALRGQPVIVGAPPTQRGVVCASSYEARKFGVRSAMPSATAGRLCPKGIFVRPRMDHYREESRQIMQIVAETGAVVEQMSIDEAYIDMSALCQAEDADASLLRAVPLARELKQRICSERRLTATIGVAANKLLAKIASDHQKPDGLTLIPEKEKVQFLRPLPVRALYGVGKVTEGILNRAGVETVGDLQDYPGDLRALVGSFGPTLKAIRLRPGRPSAGVGRRDQEHQRRGDLLERHRGPEGASRLPAGAGRRHRRPAEAPPVGSAYGAGQGEVWRLYHAHAPNHRGRPADGSQGHLPAGMLPVGPGKAGVASAAAARPWGLSLREPSGQQLVLL